MTRNTTSSTPARATAAISREDGKQPAIQRQPGRELTPREQKAIDRFFTRMQAIYRHLWSGAFTTESMLREAQLEWADSFTRARLTFDEISDGIIRAKQTYTRPPTPKEFLDLLPRRRAEHRVFQSKALPEPPEQAKARKEKGKQRIAALKQSINSNKGDSQ